MNKTNYLKFLEQKQKTHILSGFDVEENGLNNFMFPFQKFIVKRALKAGKYAIFADCGLGKTLMQLEWANQVAKHTMKPVLILAPLAVSGQTIKEGSKFGIGIGKYGTEHGHMIYISMALNANLLYKCNIINQHPIGLEWKTVTKTTN